MQLQIKTEQATINIYRNSVPNFVVLVLKSMGLNVVVHWRPPNKRSFIYQYHPTQEGLVAKDFFEAFKGYLHVDCYGGYDQVFLDKNLTVVACRAHARRNFFHILKTTKKQKALHILQ